MTSQTGDDYGSPARNDPPSPTSAISVHGLRKQYGEGPDAVEAVNGIDFEINQGSIVGILGPNGAGKTTVIKSLLSLVSPSEGDIRVAGADVQADAGTAFQHIGAVLEGARNVYWRLTVEENMRFFSAIAGQDPSTMTQRFEELLTKFGLESKRNTAVRNLSRGQKQKVSIACTLARNADVIFLDEPTLGLDVESSIELRAELRNLAEESGTTVVLSSHDMDVIEDVCDRVIIMNDGEIVVDDDVDNLLSVFSAQAYCVTTQEPITGNLKSKLQRQYTLEEDSENGRRNQYELQIVGDQFYDAIELLQIHGATIESFDAIDIDLEEVFLRLTRDSNEDSSEESYLAMVNENE